MKTEETKTSTEEQNEALPQANVSGSGLIIKDNFKDFIGRKVNPECIGKYAAFLTPDVNILLSYLDNIWYFKSPDETNTTEEVWMYQENENWSIEVYLAE